jgi:putative SOS response-associated peptidase YedK
MCGRFTLTVDGDSLEKHYDLQDTGVHIMPRYNICPGEEILLIRQTDNHRQLARGRWGLVPGWAKEPGIGSRLINARAETVAEKPSFRAAFRQRRCLIPADGFYEWQASGNGKQPFWMGFEDRRLFSFAGLWEQWTDKHSGEYIESCTIITTEANAPIRKVHHRMPVIIDPTDYDIWLEPCVDSTNLQRLFTAHDSTDMTLYPVSKVVNRAGYDNKECLQPLRTMI